MVADRPAPDDLFSEWAGGGDGREEISKTPTDARYCRCDWTFHRGRECGNQLPAVGRVLIETQLCTPCLHSCQAEREEVLANDPTTRRR
jgi:hypothetical protein